MHIAMLFSMMRWQSIEWSIVVVVKRVPIGAELRVGTKPTSGSSGTLRLGTMPTIRSVKVVEGS